MNNILDIHFCREYNDDLNHMSDDKLLIYLNNFGINENRVFNAETFSIKYFNNYLDFNDENIKIFHQSKLLSELVKNKNNTDKLQILSFTNCQGMMLINCLKTLNLFNKYFNCIYIQNYENMNDEKRLEFNNLLKNIDIFLYQPVRDIHSNNSKDILNLLPERTKKISMPYIYCNWYWLFNIIWDETINKLHVIHHNINKEQIKYILENNIINFELEERMEKSLNILSEKELNLDIKVCEFIKNNYKKKRLFFNKNHFTKPVILFITNKFLELLDINIRINEDIHLGIYNSNVFIPITSYIKKILHLEFQEDSIGDNFFIDYFYDYINKLDNEKLIQKYELCENPDIYFKDII